MVETMTHPEAQASPVLITKKEAAEMLSCSVKTIERMIAANGWQTVELSQRALRIVKADIEAFINRQLKN